MYNVVTQRYTAATTWSGSSVFACEGLHEGWMMAVCKLTSRAILLGTRSSHFRRKIGDDPDHQPHVTLTDFPDSAAGAFSSGWGPLSPRRRILVGWGLRPPGPVYCTGQRVACKCAGSCSWIAINGHASWWQRPALGRGACGVWLQVGAPNVPALRRRFRRAGRLLWAERSPGVESLMRFQRCQRVQTAQHTCL